MEIKQLKRIPNLDQNKKLNRVYTQFDTLLAALREKNLSEEIVEYINTGVDQINAVNGSEKAILKQVRSTQSSILRLMEKKLKLVTKNHYRNLWLSLGMAAIGIPIGVAFGASFGNMGLLALGIPIGMVIGLVIGTKLDRKVLEEGNQLDIEIKY